MRTANHRYVFVAGLHRTGSSLLARTLGLHDAISSICGAPVPENEGAYLQGAIPHTARHGIPGEFATDPQQHLTEIHPLNSLETKLRLEYEWGQWFDGTKPWRVEKSPVNLTRMRLLQALFPLSQFVIITRHPLFMAHALRKWSGTSVDELAQYGVDAYRQALQDIAYLHAAMVVRYEDLVAHPTRQISAVEAFLDLPASIAPAGIRNGNVDYDVPDNEIGSLPELGYGAGGSVLEYEPVFQHPLRNVRNNMTAILCADSK